MTSEKTSLGDLISALYDATAELPDESARSGVVAACTLDVLRRRHLDRLVEELVMPAESLHN